MGRPQGSNALLFPVNPEPETRRKRLRFWLAAVSVVVFSALASGGMHFWKRSNAVTGVDYFRPEWRIPALVSDAEANRRKGILASMGTEQALPLLLEGAAKPCSDSGAIWQDLVEKLPADLAVYLPQYQTRRTYDFLSELASDSSQPAVAKAVARDWSLWDVGRQVAFLECLESLPGVLRSVDPALVPILVSKMAHPDKHGGHDWAAGLAAGLTNRPPELDEALSALPDLYPVVLARLAGGGILSGRLERALAEGPASEDPQLRFWYAMTLARCVPERHPPEQVLGDLLSGELFLNRSDEVDRLLIRGRFFEPVVSTPFFRRRCLAILSGPEADAAVRERVLQVLARVASPDDETALGLRPWLTARESGLFPVAMRAFLASASPRTENVVLVASGLTHKRTCAATLLWLTEAGTNAMPLASAVEAMAHDVFPAGMQEGSADRMELTREDTVRYGLLSSASSPRRPGSLGPSTVLAQPNADIPVRLLPTWPKREVLDGGGARRTRMVPEIPLNSLAERCLRSMRGEPLE